MTPTDADLAWPTLMSHAVALASWLALVLHWLRRSPSSRRDFGVAALLAVVIAAVFAWAVDPAAIPTRWITALHEGRAERTIRHLYGISTHAESNWYGVVSWLRSDPAMGARDLVRLNLGLGALNTVLLAVALRAMLASRLLAALLTLCWAASANHVNAMCSELPSELLSTYFLLALLPVAVFEAEPAPRRGNAALLAIANVACWASLAALTRPETLAIGVPAVLAMLLRAVVRDELVDRLATTLKGYARAYWWASLSLLYLVAITTRTLADYAHQSQSTRVRWALESFQFWWPTRIALPVVLADFQPLPVVAVTIVGLLLALRRPLRTTLLPVSIVAVWAVYQAASHDAPYERFRYVSMLAAPLIVLAGFGVRELEAVLSRWPAWRRPVAWGLVALSVISVLPGIPGRSAFALRAAVAGQSERGLLLERNKQVAVRYLLDATASQPDCVFVARVSSRPESRSTPPLDRWVFFGWPLVHPISVPAQGQTLTSAIRYTVREGTCVLYYRSMDCNLLRAHGECEADLLEARALDRRSIRSRPYSDQTEYGRLSSVVEFGLFQLPERR